MRDNKRAMIGVGRICLDLILELSLQGTTVASFKYSEFGYLILHGEDDE
jgi:hypothetical protein